MDIANAEANQLLFHMLGILIFVVIITIVVSLITGEGRCIKSSLYYENSIKAIIEDASNACGESVTVSEEISKISQNTSSATSEVTENSFFNIDEAMKPFEVKMQETENANELMQTQKEQILEIMQNLAALAQTPITNLLLLFLTILCNHFIMNEYSFIIKKENFYATIKSSI